MEKKDNKQIIKTWHECGAENVKHNLCHLAEKLAEGGDLEMKIARSRTRIYKEILGSLRKAVCLSGSELGSEDTPHGQNNSCP